MYLNCLCMRACVIFSYLRLVLTTACYVAILDIYICKICTFAKHRQTSAQNPAQHTICSLSSSLSMLFSLSTKLLQPKMVALQTSFRLSRLMGLWDCAIGGHFHVPSISAAPSNIKLYDTWADAD